MTKETAAFAVQRYGDQSAKHIMGSHLRLEVKDKDLFAVQNTDTARHWEYRESTSYDTITWEMQRASDIESTLGLTPTEIRNGSIEVDMFRGADNTIYYIYFQYLLKSTNGFTWEIVNDDLPFHAKGLELNRFEAYRCQSSYIDGNMFVSVLNYIYKSSDNGVSWRLVSTDFITHYDGKFDNPVRKATNTDTGQSMLYFCSGKYDKAMAWMLYSLDEGETWVEFRVYAKAARRIQYHESKNQFLFLSDYNDSSPSQFLVKLTFDQVLSDYGYPDTIADVDAGFYVQHENFILTPDYIMIWGPSGYNYILDNDYNPVQFDYTCAWSSPRHCTHVRYDPACDDVLFGEMTHDSNSTSTPRSGRAGIKGMKSGNLCQSVDKNTESHNCASMIYHPPTKRYYQAHASGVYYSFEQEPGAEDFYEKRIPVITNNLNEIEDDFMLCCTDRDDVSYSVTGAQFKDLFILPWETWTGAVLHIKNVSETMNINANDGSQVSAYTVDGRFFSDTGDINPGEELVFTISGNLNKTFFSDKGTWEFGEITDTSTVTNMSEMFYGCTNFNSDVSMFDTSSVTDMSEMFHSCDKFNGDCTGWDVGQVTDMHNMFKYALDFDRDISNWNVSNVKDMAGMFTGNYYFSADIGKWDMRNVETIHSMFNGCYGNPDISAWDTHNITDMGSALYGTGNFDQDLTEWCVDPQPINTYFAKGSGIPNSKLPQWGTCPRGENTK